MTNDGNYVADDSFYRKKEVQLPKKLTRKNDSLMTLSQREVIVDDC